MHKDIIARESRTAYLYRERRVQHRYHRRHEKPEALLRELQRNGCSPFEFPDQLKTMDYHECDELMFSDSRIKNYHHQSAQTYSIRNRVPKNTHNRCSQLTSTPIAGVSFRNRQESLEPGPSSQERHGGTDIRWDQHQGGINCYHMSETKPTRQIQLEGPHKRTTSAINRRKLKKKSCSMDEGKNKESTLSPTIISMKLSSPTHIDRTIAPNNAKASLSSQKPPKRERMSLIFQEKKKTPSHKKDHSDRMKYALNGWQFQNPSFHQFQELYPIHPTEKDLPKPREVKTAGERRLLYQRGRIS